VADFAPGRDPEGRITIERRGQVLLIGIDRVEKLNGFTPQMADQLTDAYTELHRDPELFVGLVFAHGEHFTAGLDLPKWTDSMKGGDSLAGTAGRIDPFSLGRRCAKPVVVAVHGITFTAGIELMLGADIVVAADDCRFSQLEPKRGIMATGGATFRFVERGGWGNAMLHLLTCDEFDAAEALRIGIVQQVVPAGEQLDRALAIAQQIASMAPLAVQAMKASSLLYAQEGERACIEALSETQSRLAKTEDADEGVAAFKERRDPVFKGR